MIRTGDSTAAGVFSVEAAVESMTRPRVQRQGRLASGRPVADAEPSGWGLMGPNWSLLGPLVCPTINVSLPAYPGHHSSAVRRISAPLRRINVGKSPGVIQRISASLWMQPDYSRRVA